MNGVTSDKSQIRDKRVLERPAYEVDNQFLLKEKIAVHQFSGRFFAASSIFGLVSTNQKMTNSAEMRLSSKIKISCAVPNGMTE
jgi:hypothetical protein